MNQQSSSVGISFFCCISTEMKKAQLKKYVLCCPWRRQVGWTTHGSCRL